ncbi:hypothetical protein TNCV_1442481 [Trichonephila clavipes]|uniref:Uncharacterized protein n=1 Tax=Trichonephila clavipes TaxID=2585209 RepID=A0A8X6RPX9_TRICX|nr:hypothetical protein TNCV_1442481 [Trichonephila clavipes]
MPPLFRFAGKRKLKSLVEVFSGPPSRCAASLAVLHLTVPTHLYCPEGALPAMVSIPQDPLARTASVLSAHRDKAKT